ncbi:ABC transporter substrate-binding protein [Arthrobacter sp. zg-Y179]|uniref:ABC transporter substrate-binding protein n=1 Tax=Arthrobacter sp. zg-Y179 TaxID=2894188 RepID=UPI001E2B1AEF|nr:ABC transporter substrate-binding protein [Arthrobacter sp. zg-Y179]MCC9174033.1 ABC transporter substrate-binding protein [Arthrobacter sp. zg-Y179]
MPQSVDVGSVLGGRYKVTALVLASAEQDMVLDGVDQVLNRSVSILVAAPMNASQVSASAREIATGERHGNVQVLDLGVSDGRTYLVTNTASAADLLDLVIERDAPYVEPFFTDTLGSEIFGVPRSREPETVEEDRYVEHEEREQRKPLLSGSHKPKLPRFGRTAAAAGAGAGAAAAERDLQFGESADAPAEAATGGANVPPPPANRPRQSAAEAGPAKVTKWEDDEPQAAPVPERNSRSASTFPKSALAAGNYDEDGYGYGDPDEDYEEDSAEEKPNRKSGRVLIGAVLSLVLVLAVVLAVSQLGKMGDMFESNPEAGASTEPTQDAAQAAPSADAAAPAPAPEIAGITRLVPGNPQLDSGSDGALPQIIDGNPSSYWSSYVYASDTFGGLAQSMAMVVDLGTESAVNEVNITQLNGTGGSFSVMLNDTPDLEGATSVAQSGFTGPTTSIPVPKTDGQPATARYVIINFTQLPRLNGVQAAYPWGLRIAEIGVS